MFQCPGTAETKGTFGDGIAWPKCVTESICPVDTLPEPDAASGLQIKPRKGNILLGEYAIYECIRRKEFYEMNIVSRSKSILAYKTEKLSSTFSKTQTQTII